MGNLTDEAERRVLDWITGRTVAQPVAPLTVRLMGTNGDSATAGVEIVGDMYEPQALGEGAAATVSGVTKTGNVAAVEFPALDETTDVTVVGFEIWDSASFRVGHHAFAGPVLVPLGESAFFDPNTLTLTVGSA